MINEEEVKHIAKLARLELTGKEVKKMQKNLSEILDYFDLLKKVPRSALRTETPAKGMGAIRKDESVHSPIANKIIEASPDKKDGYIKVKTIL